jgi:hypothetical protein
MTYVTQPESFHFISRITVDEKGSKMRIITSFGEKEIE